MVAKRHKITNVPLCCARDNLRGQKSLGPLKMSLEMAQKVIVPQKKIMSRSFLNSGTLIVNFRLKIQPFVTEKSYQDPDGIGPLDPDQH
jgi:hypothetical protein